MPKRTGTATPTPVDPRADDQGSPRSGEHSTAPDDPPWLPDGWFRYDDGSWGNSGDDDSGADNGPGGRVGTDKSGIKWVAPYNTPDEEMREHGLEPDQTTGLAEFKAETTSNPGKGNSRRTTGKRKPATAVAPPGDGTVGDMVPVGGPAEDDLDDPAEQQLRAMESVPDVQTYPMDDLNDYLRVMYFGQEGTRKTTNALLMTRLGSGKVLLVNAEGGAKKTPLRKYGVDTSRIEIWPKPGERVSFAGLERLFYRIAAELMDDSESWLGVVWDSATDIHQALLDQVVEGDIERQQAIIAKNKGRRPGNVVLRDRFDTDRDDYKRMSNQFRLLLRKFRDLPCHMVVTALLRVDEIARRQVQGPAVTPAIQTDLLGYMDMVLFTQVARFGESYVGFAQSVAESTLRAKDRFDVLPAEVPNPTMERLYAYMVGDLTADNDPDLALLSTGAQVESTKPTTRVLRAVKKDDGPTDAAAKDVVARADAAAQRAENPVREAVKATAARRASGKKRTPPADPVPSGGPDDQPPY